MVRCNLSSAKSGISASRRTEDVPASPLPLEEPQMKRTSGAWTTRLVVSSVVIVAALRMTACNSSGDAGDQSGATGSTAGATDSGRAQTTALRVGVAVPRLPEKIETISAEALLAVVDGRTWTGQIVERECGEPNCSTAPGGPKSTILRNEAVAGVNDLAFDTLPPNGVVVGRMTNLGQHKDALYQLPAHKGDWYVILTRGPTPATATLQLANLDFRGNGKPVKDLMPTSWIVSKCDDGHTGPYPSPNAGFKDCTGAPTPGVPLVATSFNRGAWFTCSLGCCTTDSGRPGVPPNPGDSIRPDSGRPRPRSN
jgi:hypothetical protein